MMRKIITLQNCKWLETQLIYNTKNKLNLTLLKIYNVVTSNISLFKVLNLKPILLFIGILFFSIDGNAQNAQVKKIHFDYDTAGNQITREFCLSCLAKTSDSTKNISDLGESDLQKFNSEDNFTFYPNPVKEELYLKWDNSSQIKLQTIKLYSLNGALLKSFENQMSVDSNNIHFQEYPIGVYIIEMLYTNGDVKSIKIIKQ